MTNHELVKVGAGKTFGRWLVLEMGTRNEHCHVRWRCRCECGAEAMVLAQSLRRGTSRGCAGCNERNRRHGASGTSTYISWRAMRQRCEDPNVATYYGYGGRGIYVCPQWSTFEQFLVDMGEKPSSSHSIERMNPDGPYAPWNCRWATTQEQNNNRRNSRPSQERWTTLLLEYHLDKP